MPPRPPLPAAAGPALLAAGLGAAALVSLWPLPVLYGEALAVDPAGESAAHLWALWEAGGLAALRPHDTALLNAPDGMVVSVIDPLHRLPYALGAALGGPGLGFAAVQLWGLVAAGLAGALLAGQRGADPGGRALGAAAGMGGGALLGAAADGITEGLGAGLVGLQLWALLRLLRAPSAAGAAGYGLLIGACAAAGPYNAVWAALLDGPVLAAALLRRGPGARAALGGAAVGLGLGLLILAPQLDRGGAAPGTAGRAAIEGPPAAGAAWRGAWRQGADLLDLAVPAALTGPVAPAPTTAHLGLLLPIFAVLGARRAGRAGLPWLLGGLGFALLALGPVLSVGGELARVGGRPLLLPAGLLEQIPGLDRLSRWYRAGAVAALLLGALAGAALRGRAAWAAALLVALELRLAGPVPWPLPVLPLPTDPLADLPAGPLVTLPLADPSPADGHLLRQIAHQRPIGATRDGAPSALEASAAYRRLRQAALTAPPDAVDIVRVAADGLAAAGFSALEVDPAALPPAGLAALEAALGPARAGDGGRSSWPLRGTP